MPLKPCRRDFLKRSASFAMGAPLLGGRADAKANLLFIWTDEQRADTMAVYGNRRIHAPNLNAFAKESIVFEHAYVSQPVCTPSRSTVMTGLWPHQSGCVENNIPLPGNVACFPELLNDPDYRTGYFGKWHLGDEIFAQHGFEEWQSIEDGYRSYFSRSRDKSARSTYCQWLKELGYKPDESDSFSRGFCSNLPLEHCKPKFLELKACDFLQRHRRDPFVLFINFLEPHMPFNGPLNHEHDPAEMALPASFYTPLGDNDPLRYRRLVEQYRTSRTQGQDMATEAGWRRIMANYWGLVTQVDRSVGAILRTLEQLDLADNTIVVYTSDHGDMMGAHRLLAKTVMYEEAVKIPWLMRVPQIGRRQNIVKGRFGHVDLVPTLLELLGKDWRSRPEFKGESLVPLIGGRKRSDDHVYIEWNHAPRKESKKNKAKAKDAPVVSVDTSDDSIRTVIAPDGWKLCVSDKDKCQLFNLNKDPGEMSNLFYSGTHKDIVARLTEAIHAWQKRVGDTVVV